MSYPRFRIPVGTFLALLFLALPGPSPAQSARDLKTENVILITSDGLRWQEVFNGADKDLIRNEKAVEHVDALAEQFCARRPRPVGRRCCRFSGT